MQQAELELQLKVWKELAINKQMLMRSAAEALKLNPDCTTEELKNALEHTFGRISKAEAESKQAQEDAKAAIAAMEKKLKDAVQAQAAAEANAAELQKRLDQAIHQITASRAAAQQEQQKLRASLAESEKSLKAIKTALADSPENVLKKMNALKKQKQEEADARRQIETALATERKEKQQQGQKLTKLRQSTEKLVERYRELHGVTAKFHEQLQPLVTDAKTLPALPELDSKLIEEIENPDAAEKDEKGDGKKNSKKK